MNSFEKQGRGWYDEADAASLPGSGLTVEFSPLSFPNRGVVLRGRKTAVEAPGYPVVIPHAIFGNCPI
jgi:hypothetical protein